MVKGRPQKLTLEMQRYLLGLIEKNRKLISDQKEPQTQTQMYDALVQKFTGKLRASISGESPENALKAAKSEQWLQEEVAYRLPGLSSVQKFIAEHPYNVIPEEDWPWSSAGINKVNVPSDVIPVIIQLERHPTLTRLTRGKDFEEAVEKGFPSDKAERIERIVPSLTIRQVKWITYLYPALKHIARSRGDNVDYIDLEGKEDAVNHVLFWLLEIVRIYARAERVCKELKINNFETRKLDSLFLYPGRFFHMGRKEKFNCIIELLFD